MSDAVLVACAHGTRNPTGRRLIAELALAAKDLRPGLVTTAAFVDVQPPTVADVVAGLAADGRPAVVVPLLLAYALASLLRSLRDGAGPGRALVYRAFTAAAWVTCAMFVLVRLGKPWMTLGLAVGETRAGAGHPVIHEGLDADAVVAAIAKR